MDFYSRDASTHFQHPTNQVVKIWGIKNTILTMLEISSATLTMLMIPTDPVSYCKPADLRWLPWLPKP